MASRPASVLFELPEEIAASPGAEAPAYFPDLNLDQVVEAATQGRESYDLEPFFSTQLHTESAVEFRQAVFRDLENQEILEAVQEFAEGMRLMRSHLDQAEKLYYQRQKQRWTLDALGVYCQSVSRLAERLGQLEPGSAGLASVRRSLAEYVSSDAFRSLAAEGARLTRSLAQVRYCLSIKGTRITASRFQHEPDYSQEIEEAFAKFREGAAKDYRIKFAGWPDMNHVEAGILDLVARLEPELFSELEEFCLRHLDFLDPQVARFDRELQFYLAYLEYLVPLREAGLPLCYPLVSSSKSVAADDTFDIALARRLVAGGREVVRNDFSLSGEERVLVVSGPNQGGKTTFSRTFGQLHHLASLGCPVPGRQARLFLFDQLFTHYEREESLETMSGKLEEELIRIHEILDQATADSILIMNESFSSTALNDALFLGREVLERVIEKQLICVCVTFVDALASLSPATVSMVSTVFPDNPAERTYRVVRRPADGLAYAIAIAEKYGLTYGRLRERLAP